MNGRPAFKLLRALVRLLKKWLGDPHIAVASWEKHEGHLNREITFTLRVPPLPPPPPEWEQVIRAQRARMVAGIPFQSLAAAASRGVCICALLKDGSELERPGLLEICGSPPHPGADHK